MQIGFRVLGAVAAVYVKVKQRCIRIGGGKQPANVALGNFDRFGYHFGASQKKSFSVIISHLQQGHGGAAENFAGKTKIFWQDTGCCGQGEKQVQNRSDAHAACASVLRFSFYSQKFCGRMYAGEPFPSPCAGITEHKSFLPARF